MKAEAQEAIFRKWIASRLASEKARERFVSARANENRAATAVLAVVIGATGEKLGENSKRVFRGVCRGLMNKEIAAELSISERTVKWHLALLLRKLGARNRFELVRHADELLADETWKRIGKPEAGASSTSPGARG